MAVTTSNLYSESDTVLRNLLNSQVTDPKINQTNSRRRWIYREQPDTTRFDFNLYPLIILRHSNLDNSDVITLNQTFRDNILVFEIEVQTVFQDDNARLNEICDDILNALCSSVGQDTLNTNKLFNPVITSSGFNQTVIDGKQISSRLMILEVSAELCYSS